MSALQFDVDAWMREDRDYPSLRIAYYRLHGEPMPDRLQREVLTLQTERIAA